MIIKLSQSKQNTRKKQQQQPKDLSIIWLRLFVCIVSICSVVCLDINTYILSFCCSAFIRSNVKRTIRTYVSVYSVRSFNLFVCLFVRSFLCTFNFHLFSIFFFRFISSLVSFVEPKKIIGQFQHFQVINVAKGTFDLFFHPTPRFLVYFCFWNVCMYTI